PLIVISHHVPVSLYLRYNISFSLSSFTDTSTTMIYTLSLHDALPICVACSEDAEIESERENHLNQARACFTQLEDSAPEDIGKKDRKSTRLNSSHGSISYAVLCLKKKSDTDLEDLVDR